MISKQELIEIINSLKIKFNPDILDKLTKRVEKMTNSEYLEILTKENIKTSSDAEKRIENMVLTMEKTRLQRQEGEYEERITQDDILNDIFQRARKLNNRNVNEIKDKKVDRFTKSNLSTFCCYAFHFRKVFNAE